MIEQNLVALLPWEITAATQLEFKAKFDSFSNLLSKPRQATSLAKRIGSEVESKIKMVIDDYKNLDILINAQQKKHPAFVKEYLINRQLVELPTTKRAAICKVLDADTKSPVAKAKFTTPFGVFKSTSKGNLIIPSAGEGSWPVTVSKPGCLNAEFMLVIVNGETNKQIVYLQAA